MHELSLCRSIAHIAERHCQGRPVLRIGLDIGALRQVVPDTLTYCWQVVSDQTALAGSVLDVRTVAAVIRCRGCGLETELTEPRFACPACEGTDVEVIRGEEFLVTSMDLAKE